MNVSSHTIKYISRNAISQRLVRTFIVFPFNVNLSAIKMQTLQISAGYPSPGQTGRDDR